ncbi:MAG: glycosyltransferase [Pirellulales bacterium]
MIAVGRLWPQKGYRDLIWGGELLRTADPQATLVIIGDGPEREQLLHYRDQVLAQHAVRLVGHRTDATELMSGADVVWNGSLYEGQSNTILEAMSLGIPVIASDIPGNRDLIVPGETGFLFQLGDTAQLTKQTCSLFSDAAKAEAMGAAARCRIAAEFSVDQMVRKHETLYQNTVA